MAAAAAMIVGVAVMSSASPVAAADYCGLPETDQNVFSVNDGLWSNPVNWSRNHLPTSGEAVCVPGGIVAQVSSASTYLLGAQGGFITTLRVEGTIRINGGNTVSLASAIFGGSNLFNGGVIQVLNGSTFDMNADQNGAPAFQNVIGGSLIQVSSGSKILLRRPFLNTGTINLTGGGQMILDSAPSSYSVGASNGAVIGGQIKMTSGSVVFGGTGALSVLATGGSTTGTIAATQSLDIACSTSSGAINWTGSLVNNGAVHFLPPLAGACEMDYTLPGGSSFTNNGTLTFGNPGVAATGGSVAYASNFFTNGGQVTNSAAGTIVVNDYWSMIGPTTNQGTITVAAGGFYEQRTDTLTNSGTLVNGDRCDLNKLDSSGGTVELKKSCNIRTTATFTASSTLRPHSSASALAKLIVAQTSSINGTIDVVTDGTPPAVGTTRDVITGPVSGTFASVTSQSPDVSYTALYPGGAVQLQAGAGAGAINAVVPGRVLDTRPNGATVDGVAQRAGLQNVGATVEIPVLNRAGVPANATAVVLNVTVTEPVGAGFVTVWPCGANRPATSSLNFAAASTVPNGVISKVGTNGKVCVFVSNATQVLADVGGYFTDASPYKPLVPARLLDTRTNGATVDGLAVGGGPVAQNVVKEVQVTNRGGVPVNATAVVLNVTVTESQGAGFVTVFPCGATPPTASNLNFVAGGTIANNVIAKVGTGGKVCFVASKGVQLLADVNGYFGVGAGFSGITPQRFLDTRQGQATVDGLGQGGGAPTAGTVVQLQVTGRVGVPGGATAAVLNITVTETQGAGFVTVFPCGSPQPTASSLNFVLGSTVPNGVIVKVGTGGKVCLVASKGTQFIADLNGYFTS